MAGKSIDDILRQQAAQRQAAMQAQQAQERAINEQRERARQEHLQRMRMFEALNTISNTSTAAAGAGGGGLINTTPNSVSDESILYYNWSDRVFTYFIYNFETDVLTDTKTINMYYSPDNYDDIKSITKGGFFIKSPKDDNSNYDLFFIGLNGEVAWQDTTDNIENVDIENFSRYIAAYYLKDGIWKLVVFDKDGNIKSFEFQNPIEGGGYSYDDVWSNGFVVREDILGIFKYYIINVVQGTSTLFKEINSDQDDVNVYLYAYSDKILTVRNDTFFEVWNKEGQKISEFDTVVEFESVSYSYNNFAFLDANGSFVFYGVPQDDKVIIFFSGVSNEFSYKFAPTGYNNYEYDVENQKNYRFTEDNIAEGSAMFLLYTDDNRINGINYYDDAVLLPVWSTDTQLGDFHTFSTTKGIQRDLDDSNLTITRSADYINLLIDNDRGGIYYFSDYGEGNSNEIGDGGDDMYDVGNRIYVDGNQISYTHTQLSTDQDGGMNVDDFISDGVVSTGTSPSVFGASNSNYFTNLYPGLFVLAAQNIQIDEFRIDGGLGAGGLGTSSISSLEIVNNSINYGVFTKSVYAVEGQPWGGEPSINQTPPAVVHIIITKGSTYSGITHSIGGSTDEDYNNLQGLDNANVTEIYYLLIALKNAVNIENDKVLEIVTEFLTILNSSEGINDFLNNLNSNYGDITNVLPKPDQNYSILRFNREGEETTLIPTDISKSINFNDNGDDDQINGKTILQIRREFLVTGTWSWSDLSNVEERFYYSFDDSIDGNENNIVGQEFVMKDTINVEYWAIKFTEWNNGTGAFSYTRQLISGGTFSGDVITFSHVNWADGVADIIDPGVLEIKRGPFGYIYNSAVEGESNGENPKGTLWNSFFVYNTEPSYNYKWWNKDATSPTSSVAFNALFEGQHADQNIDYYRDIDWTNESGKPGYLPSQNFAWQVECLLKVDIAGDYLFKTNSDDGNQLTINGSIVTEFYGPRGTASGGETSSTISLAVGFHTLRYRMEQGGGGAAASVSWKVPGEDFSIIPSSNLVINQSISEYDHYIVSNEGEIVDKVTTGSNYDNDWNGATYILEDEVFSKTWVSNNLNDKQFTLLDKYYTRNSNSNNTSEESGLILGNHILSSGFSSIIVTEDSISDEFIVPSPGFLSKIDDRGIFNNGAWVKTTDENNINFYFYNLSGELVGQKILDGVLFSSYNSYNYGKRCSIVYQYDGVTNVITFNGTVIREANNLSNLDILVNDFNTIWC